MLEAHLNRHDSLLRSFCVDMAGKCLCFPALVDCCHGRTKSAGGKRADDKQLANLGGGGQEDGRREERRSPWSARDANQSVQYYYFPIDNTLSWWRLTMVVQCSTILRL